MEPFLVAEEVLGSLFYKVFEHGIKLLIIFINNKFMMGGEINGILLGWGVGVDGNRIGSSEEETGTIDRLKVDGEIIRVDV